MRRSESFATRSTPRSGLRCCNSFTAELAEGAETMQPFSFRALRAFHGGFGAKQMSKRTQPFFPIIYVRGFAATMGEIEDATASPYMGFNDGATKIRQNHEG